MNKEMDIVHTPSWVQPKVNITTILALAGAVWWITTYIHEIKNTQEMQTQTAISTRLTTEKNFDEVNAALEKLNELPEKVESLQRSDAAQNARLDRIAETVIEAIRKDIAAVSIKVEVSSSKIDSLTEKVDNLQGAQGAQRTRFNKEASVPHPDKFITR